ncbi:nitrate- and nitrite sensing domain-containing protein [Andreprevotia chitinilytica]|uniref:nitrate- and nitrite sensing domain-containing protein n=1 Tax=Andreprevotia chitinilytica TaxID=396808 RepID=UPI000A022D4E|nr:nitrate- and nitrite sensing domain-containing protein [Andreprevotia chitinilytica]
MVAIATSVGILTSATAAMHWAQAQSDKKHAARRDLSLGAVNRGVALMTVVQQHRGMAAALLNGDQSFADRLNNKQQEVDNTLSALGEYFARVTEFAAGGKRLEAIRAAWAQLRQEARRYTVEKSFATHTALIQQVLYLLGDMGERGGLLEVRNPALATLAEVLLLRLPLLTESIGQARALGTGYAVRGRCGAVGRIRLSFLQRRIRDCLNRANVIAESPTLAASTQACRHKVDALQTLIDTHLTGVERIELAPDAYFRAATEAIDACLALWHAAEQATRQVLPGGKLLH